MTVNSNLQWLAHNGVAALSELHIASHKPLKIDWPARSRWTASQQSMLIEQLQFRQRAADRFPDPERWLWTDRSLQQASDWQSALYKASLITRRSQVVDACCGAGADLVAIAMAHDASALDRDADMLELARANITSHALTSQFVLCELPQALGNLEGVYLHIDPDRRRGNDRDTRTTHGQSFSPSLSDAMLLGQSARGCIIKLAPATDVTEDDLGNANSGRVDLKEWRRCWLGTQRECPQQLLLRGDLLLNVPDGQAAAVLVQGESQVWLGERDVACDCAEEPEEYMIEPHAVLYAAGLTADWAQRLGYSALPHSRSYFTGSTPAPSGWAASFRVLEHMSWDERRVRKWLRTHGRGQIEFKTRQVQLDANALQRQMYDPAGTPVTCLLFRIGKSVRAVMAERIAE